MTKGMENREFSLEMKVDVAVEVIWLGTLLIGSKLVFN